MINILKAEFFKLKKSKGVLICSIILLAYMVLSLLIFLLVRNTLRSVDAEDLGGIIGIPRYTASSAVAFFANDFQIITILATIVLCGFYAGEYRYGLIRNTLVAGVSRRKVYLAKFIMAMTVAAAAYIAVTVIYMAVYGIIGGWGQAGVGEFIGYWFLNLLLFLGTAALIFMFSVLTKSTGATIGIALGMIFLFNLLSSISMLSGIMSENRSLFMDILHEISLLFTGTQISVSSSMNLEGWRLAESILVGVVTLAGAGGLGMWMFHKQDQK